MVVVDELNWDTQRDRYGRSGVRCRRGDRMLVAEGSRRCCDVTMVAVHRKMNDMQKGRAIEARIHRLVRPW